MINILLHTRYITCSILRTATQQATIREKAIAHSTALSRKMNLLQGDVGILQREAIGNYEIEVNRVIEMKEDNPQILRSSVHSSSNKYTVQPKYPTYRIFERNISTSSINSKRPQPDAEKKGHCIKNEYCKSNKVVRSCSLTKSDSSTAALQPCTCPCPTDEQNLSPSSSKPCPKFANPCAKKISLWRRIINYFKARPNCPPPGLYKKKKLIRKALKAAEKAGLGVYDPCDEPKKISEEVKKRCCLARRRNRS